MFNPFFKNNGPYNIIEIISLLNLNLNNIKKEEVHDVKDLSSASEKDLTFYHSKNIKI